MKRPKTKAGSDLSPKGAAGGEAAMQFPSLRSFMRSYLHQDFGEEYGSVEEAVKTFCDDATGTEFSAVSAEWRSFLVATQGRPIGEINNLLTSKLGSAWNPASVSELNELTQAFDDCAAAES